MAVAGGINTDKCGTCGVPGAWSRPRHRAGGPVAAASGSEGDEERGGKIRR